MTGIQCRIPPRKLLSAPQSRIIYRTFCKFVEFVLKEPQFYDFFNKNGFVINPKLKDYKDIRKMVMNFIYTKIILLLPDMMQLVRETEARLRWSDYYWIGLQIRSGHMAGDEGQNVFLYEDDIEMFMAYAVNQTEKAMQKQSKPVRWYVAGDSEDVKRKVRFRYGDYYANAECAISHSFQDVFNPQRTPGMTCTVLENYLLTDTNETIVTAASTYGLMATYRNLQMKKIMVARGDWRKFRTGVNTA